MQLNACAVMNLSNAVLPHPPGSTIASNLALQLRADIIQGRLPPGSKLRTQELADRYGVSLIPMREALSRLASSGFVRAEDQRGFRVAEVSAAELADITATRLYIEQEALRQSLEHGSLAWETALVAAHHRLSRTDRESSMQPGIKAEWDDAHTAFHIALLAGCPSPWLLNLAATLRDQTTRYRHLSVLAESKRRAAKSKTPGRDVSGEHHAIMKAALARDVGTATRLLTEHFRRTTQLVLGQEASANESRCTSGAGKR